MSNQQTASSSCGCGTFCMLLFILFLGLKLGGVGEVAEWSWLWVTAPLWGFAIVCGIGFLVVGLIAVIAFKLSDK